MDTYELDNDLRISVQTLLTSQLDDLNLLFLLAGWQLLAVKDRNFDLVGEWSTQRSEVTHRLGTYQRQLLGLFQDYPFLRNTVASSVVAEDTRQLSLKIQRLDQETIDCLVSERKAILTEKAQFDQVQNQLNRFGNTPGAKSIALDHSG